MLQLCYLGKIPLQYKNKTVFLHLSNFNIPLCRHYFVVKHGKGPSDRAGSHFRNFVRQTVKSVKEPRSIISCHELAVYSTKTYDLQILCLEGSAAVTKHDESNLLL